MAKSALMRVLRQAYRIAKTSRKTGIPTDELLGIRHEYRQSHALLTRRRLLQIGLASASAMTTAMIGQYRHQANAQSSISPVLIVGAGIAGLAAAYRLTQAGVPVDIIEARNRVGGRINTLKKAAGTPLIAELGGEFINTDHICIRSLAEELGLPLIDLLAVDAGLIPDTYFFEGRRVSLAEIINDFVPVAVQVEADLEAIDNFEDYTTEDEITIALDNISLAQYLNQIPTTPIIRQLLRIAYTIEFGLNTEEQSPLNLIYYIGTEPGTFEVFGESDERFYLDGGSEQITQRLAQILEGSITTTTVLESIREQSGGRFLVSLRSGINSLERTYERVVLTIPFSVLRTIEIDVELPEVKREAIDTVGYGTNSKLITGYTDKIWRTRFNSRGNVFTDLGFQNTWESSNSRYASSTIGLITNYTGGTQGVAVGAGTVEDQAQQLNTNLEAVFPGINSVAIRNQANRAFWTGSPFSLGSYLCYRPGEFTRFYGVEGERVGNLFFAGEHTSLEYQGFMEGGCETGELVASDILEDVGLTEIAEAIRAKLRFNRRSRIRQNRRPGGRRMQRRLQQR
ncbi:FAD binding domain protein [Lyngbya aestuarii BL J]|uniref:FAD binding domain protein n=1 Tax=Lyngbya aestuarii BL J TaxID=1348334 RepID=U7QKC6_9CYAN|nr:NAD(P)/FAD-dependent oxidoreductase [Lyngbya aestuarii]ERT07737.1 FAD binding domain protein [Lyngbya aestuarii BL J]